MLVDLLRIGFERGFFDAQPLRLDPFVEEALERVRAGFDRLARAMSADDLADPLFGLLRAAEEDFVMVMALPGRRVASQENADLVLPFNDLPALAYAPRLRLL